ncbi:PQQ-dependent sugar dehydrogenase [Oceanisphaera sp. W20_SRM_FM3]|uniref:PQQ-dependent sugar dehydrogenase n=1 Tax=Oceanisphaera sp. W20_SRM_FM3 TaxID=3240267 RepID=UPI003F9D52B0
MPNLLLLLVLLAAPLAAPQAVEYRIRRVADQLHHPWGLIELPSGELLVSERRGRLLRLHNDGSRTLIEGLPKMVSAGQGGLLDLALHPNFVENRWLYLSYSQPGKGGAGTAVARAKLHDTHLSNLEVIFVQQPKTTGSAHFGSRLVFDPQGYLFITTGERYHARDKAQQLDNHLGKILRLHDDGTVPADNPFINTPSAKPEIWSYGHRNIQGAAIHPASGVLWTHEHGPRGGDEVNIIKAGANYGWPLVTHGREYSGGVISKHTHLKGMADPIWVWVPSIAPSGMIFYRADLFPQWQGSLLVGALAGQKLVRLTLHGQKIVEEQPLLSDLKVRIRTLVEAQDGGIYLLTDAANGQLLKLVPAAHNQAP